MSVPPVDLPVPARVRALAADREITPVWVNHLGGVTYRATGPDDALYIKYGPEPTAPEAERTAWAAAHLGAGGTRVPHVVGHGSEPVHDAAWAPPARVSPGAAPTVRAETAHWLVTCALPYASAVEQRWLAEPATAVRALGVGLRRFHDALDPAACPYRWDVPTRIRAAREAGRSVPEQLWDAPEPARLVVCHGDACAPNTLLDEAGEPRAHVDLGCLGVGDVWGDLAAAVFSLGLNYGPGWEASLLDAYGIDPDPERLAYYSALWHAT